MFEITVNMGSKLSETVKGKLSLGARIIQECGRENVFKQIFVMRGAAKGFPMLSVNNSRSYSRALVYFY